MKYLKFLYIASLAVLISFATSCEKIGENKEVLNNNNNEKAFYNVKWVPVAKKSTYVNSDSLKGDLFINENNMQDLMFSIDVNENLDNPLINDPKDPMYANEPVCEEATGTYTQTKDMAGNVVGVSCEEPALNCWWTNEYYQGKWQPILNHCPKPAVSAEKGK